MKKVLILFSAVAMLASCTKESKKPDNTYVSAEVPFYHGKAWTSLSVTNSGEPKQFSLFIDNGVLNTVPLGSDGAHNHHESMAIVPVHQKVTEITPFKFVMLNWNAEGHPPAGIYTLPHFDMHFYMTNSGDVMNYTDVAKLNADPAAAYLPANHIGADPVPQMGKHWVDVTSPELNGALFTQTFIFGSYDSKVVFYEPMITLDFLKNTTDFDRALPQPAKFQVSGYYPTRMKIKKKSNGSEIILDGFTYRQAS